MASARLIRSLAAFAKGALLTALVVAGLEVLDFALFGTPLLDPHSSFPASVAVVILVSVIYALYRFGWAAASGGSVVMVLYRFFSYAETGQAFYRSAEGILRTVMLVCALAASLAVVGRLKRSSERTARLEAERKRDAAHARELEERIAERTLELQRAYEHLEELDRLKTEFVNKVSHELRTPLTSIKGYVEFLEDRLGGDLSPDQAEFVRQIQLGAERLTHLVDDLLDFARLESGTLKLTRRPSDMVALVAETLDSFRPALMRQDLRVTTEFAPEPVVLPMDPHRIGQVVGNLLSNALKFTPAGGTLQLGVRREDGQVRVEIRDSGIGIPPDCLPLLFDRFYQVDNSLTRPKEGAGLGLAISRSIVELHGGQIGVTSTPGVGSTFWFTLPLAPPVAEPPAPVRAGGAE